MTLYTHASILTTNFHDKTTGTFGIVRGRNGGRIATTQPTDLDTIIELDPNSLPILGDELELLSDHVQDTYTYTIMDIIRHLEPGFPQAKFWVLFVQPKDDPNEVNSRTY